jgi:hypothetical protein
MAVAGLSEVGSDQVAGERARRCGWASRFQPPALLLSICRANGLRVGGARGRQSPAQSGSSWKLTVGCGLQRGRRGLGSDGRR